VTELKDLLAKHSLTQTGKKDDLVKRLLDNNITLEASHEEEELVSFGISQTTARSDCLQVDLEDIEEAKPAESTAPTTSAPAVEASAPSSTVSQGRRRIW
jgi:SAP domain-containing ribonucleoprotein